MPLQGLISVIEEEDIASVDVYMIPPNEGEETDKNSDKSDDEREGNINNLGPALLKTNCEAVIYQNEPSEFDSNDDIPLINYQQNKPSTSTNNNNNEIIVIINNTTPYKKQKCQWSESYPLFSINTNYIFEILPDELLSFNSTPQFLKLFINH